MHIQLLRTIIFLSLLLLTACGGLSVTPGDLDEPNDRPSKKYGKIFGDINLVGPSSERSQAGPVGLGVNGFLWRASLDTLSFMPLLSADPFGGVIITDWYSPSDNPNERFKVTTYLLGRELRSDGIRVSVFSQNRFKGQDWVNSPSKKDTETKLEDAILNKARELRVAYINQ
ncbi:MAG: hypothetical protein CL568_08120 [Alphaproteobacteria bacterium]|jgi:hypothetical protein|nr:hypothetical protein [Alphaproteobacteria bacterium]PPR14049.1 MAG: hypothetical protein CFH42_00917 [Alphaproteobacteria bacterium MarineAlpha12_Bin1]|tara:strand:- start:2028 stop:2543 length:516 start_codon:yes stop_codon:yes gene_type:complete